MPADARGYYHPRGLPSAGSTIMPATSAGSTTTRLGPLFYHSSTIHSSTTRLGPLFYHSSTAILPLFYH